MVEECAGLAAGSGEADRWTAGARLPEAIIGKRGERCHYLFV